MKTLILMRHGKAHDHSPEGDVGRTLTQRGEQDAEIVGRYFSKTFGTPNHVVASVAARAQQTAEIAARSAGYAGTIHQEAAIYEAEWEDLLAIVRNLPDDANVVLLVGHNPGLPMLAAALDVPQTAPHPLPPAGAIILLLGITRWEQATSGIVKQARYCDAMTSIR